MSEWKECKLGDVISIKHGYPFEGTYFSDEPTENILLTPGNFSIGGGFKSDKLKYYRGDVPDDYVLNQGEVIVTMTDLSKEADTLGYSAVVPKIEGKKLLHNQRLGLVKKESKDIDLGFINWVLRTEDYRWFIIGSASGSTVYHTSPTRILDYSFRLPPLQEQRAIASVLSSLDDKIDLLHRQNKTLEALAEALFRKRFVEGADPAWDKGKLGDVIELLYGKGLKETIRTGTGYPVVGSSGIVDYHKDYLVEAPGIVIGRKGTLGSVIYMYDNFFPIDTTFFVKSKIDSVGLFYEYFLLKTCDFEEMNSDSAVPGLNRDIALATEINLPDKSTVKWYNEICSYHFTKIHKNRLQLHTLERLRDTLLPKLLSGEVRVRS